VLAERSGDSAFARLASKTGPIRKRRRASLAAAVHIFLDQTDFENTR